MWHAPAVPELGRRCRRQPWLGVAGWVLLKLQGHEFFSGDTQHVVVEPRTPQTAFPLHEHDFCELVIVASGSGWHVLNDEPHLLSSGEVLYLVPGDRHAFEQVNELYLTNVIYRPNGALLHPERLRPYLQPSREEAGERRYWQRCRA